MKKRALITGMAGQDGSYLAEYLLNHDYEVYGLIRYSTTRSELANIDHIAADVELVEGDLTDSSCVRRLVETARPHEIYNLAAQSHVRRSFEMPIATAEVTAMGVLNLLEVVKNAKFQSKVYQASTSELFGTAEQTPQDENTPFLPHSPYAVSKLFAHHMCVTYRKSYNMFVSNGILFNHESPRRGVEFVTQKVCKAAAEIEAGLTDHVELGNIDAARDWGHAKDYVRGMHLMLQHSEPDDFVLATGKLYSIRDLMTVAFEHCGLDYNDHYRINPKFYRPADVHTLIGDASKAKDILGWEPDVSFEEMIIEMVDSHREKICQT